jgi:hypothetical protein
MPTAPVAGKEEQMLTVRMDTRRLSLEELQNISRALRGPCIDCVEGGVPGYCRHRDEVRAFLTALSDAIDLDAERRERRERELALGVDPDSGEWLAGA